MDTTQPFQASPVLPLGSFLNTHYEFSLLPFKSSTFGALCQRRGDSLSVVGLTEEVCSLPQPHLLVP